MDTQERDPGLTKLEGDSEPDPLSEKIERLAGILDSVLNHFARKPDS